jgi:ribonuclease E
MNNFYNRRIIERKLRDKLKDDRARIQFGRISNFGLLEMTRQRLRESSVKWKMTLSIDSFALKVIKKAEELAFSNKAKIVKINVPLKVKNYIDENLNKEIDHFKSKYKIEFDIIAENILIIPEYKIDLQNKNKKTIKKIENIEKIESNVIKQNFKRNKFINNNFRKGKNFKKKYNYQAKKLKSGSKEKKTST